MQTNNTQLQQVINTISNWVLNQSADFTIIDIYAQPELSARLEVRLQKMLLIDEALLKLGCTIDRGQDDIEFIKLRYTPPVVVRIDRDLLCA